MHLVNDQRFWKEAHKDAAKRENVKPGGGLCGDCHGANHRGTVLSRAAVDRSFLVEGAQRKVRSAPANRWPATSAIVCRRASEIERGRGCGRFNSLAYGGIGLDENTADVSHKTTRHFGVFFYPDGNTLFYQRSTLYL